MKKIRSKTLSSVLVLVSVISSSHAFSRDRKSSGVDVFAASVDGTDLDHDGSLAFLHDRPVISPSSIELLKIDPRSLSIEFTVTKSEAKVMNGFLDKYPDKRMAFVHDGKLLFSPVIKARLTGEGMRVSFSDRASFEYAVQSLSNSNM